MFNYNFEIKKEFKGANIPRTIRFTNRLFEKLNQTAEENDISFNLLVLQCCQFALDHYKNESSKENLEK